METKKVFDWKSKEKKEFLEAIENAKEEREKLERLFRELNEYLDDLNIIFAKPEDGDYNNSRFSKDELKKMHQRAVNLSKEVVDLKKVQDKEINELLVLVKDLNKGKFGKWGEELAKDIKLQGAIDKETSVLESFFKITLDHFKLVIMDPQKLSDPEQGRNYFNEFFKNACYSVIVELDQVNKEIYDLQKELHKIDS